MIEPAKRATEEQIIMMNVTLNSRGICRPLRGLRNVCLAGLQGSASLHPGLYAVARCPGSVQVLPE